MSVWYRSRIGFAGNFGGTTEQTHTDTYERRLTRSPPPAERHAASSVGRPVSTFPALPVTVLSTWTARPANFSAASYHGSRTVPIRGARGRASPKRGIVRI